MADPEKVGPIGRIAQILFLTVLFGAGIVAALVILGGFLFGFHHSGGH